MDVQLSEEQIRTLAFYLWEQDGSPDGRADEYWEKARQQLTTVNESGNAADGNAAGFGEKPDATLNRPLAE
jgi:ABC-type thiamine transport system substrate-binding protein